MSEVKAAPKTLKDKVDLERLENMALQDLPILYASFNNLNNSIRNGAVSLNSISYEDHNKSQAGIVLDALHSLGANKVTSEMKRFGMKVRPCLKGTTEISDLALAANFLLLASKPSSFQEILKYKELAACVFAFEESVALMKNHEKTKLQSYSEKFVSPGDKGTKWADIVIGTSKLSKNMTRNMTG